METLEGTGLLIFLRGFATRVNEMNEGKAEVWLIVQAKRTFKAIIYLELLKVRLNLGSNEENILGKNERFIF